MASNVKSINEAKQRKETDSIKADKTAIIERMFVCDGVFRRNEDGTYEHDSGAVMLPGTADFRAHLIQECFADPILRSASSRTVDEAIQVIATGPGRKRDGIIDYADSPAEVTAKLTEAALRCVPDLYARGGALARVCDGVIEPVEPQWLSHAMSSVLERDARGVLAPVSQTRVRAWAAATHWDGLPDLDGISATPFLRADGTVCQTPGYDRASRFYYAPVVPFELVPDEPTAEQLAAAIELVSGIFEDFPFELPDYKAGCWAMIVSLLRPHVAPVPLFVFDATRRGTGKSLLADVCAIIGTGSENPAHTSWIEGANASAEARKSIDAALIAGKRLLYFDNVKGEFGDTTIAGLLTSKTWEGRVLGSSRMFRAPNRTVMCVSANNASLYDDLARRTVTIRQDAKRIDPEARTGFRHRLPDDAISMRGRLVPAVLTVCRAYQAAGAPSVDIPAMGSFDDWTRFVRAPMAWAGIGDPRSAAVVERLNTTEESEQLAADIVAGVRAVAGSAELTAQQILAKWQAGDGGDDDFAWGAAPPVKTQGPLEMAVSAAEALAGVKKLTPVTLGRVLAKIDGRVTSDGTIRSRIGHARKRTFRAE